MASHSAKKLSEEHHGLGQRWRGLSAPGPGAGACKVLTAGKRQQAVPLYQEKRLTVQEICEMMSITKPALYAYVCQVQSSS